MSYTPSPLKARTEPGNFGGLVNDANHNAMTGAIANVMQTEDTTGTPVVSPATVNTTATLKVPQNAVSVVICSASNAVQVSEDSTQTSYFLLPAGVPWEFEVARQQYVYLKTGSSTSVSFYFNMV